MSWHTSAIVMEGDHTARALEVFGTFGFSHLRYAGEVDGDEAFSVHLDGKAAGVVQGWTLFWDPMMFLGEDPEVAASPGLWPRQVEEALARWSESTRIYSFLTEGASGTHGFAWYANGRRQRVCLRQQGEIVFEGGSALPEERKAEVLEPDEEQRLFVLMEGLTGVSMDAAISQTFALYA
jgi:hypothetical protein